MNFQRSLNSAVAIFMGLLCFLNMYDHRPGIAIGMAVLCGFNAFFGFYDRD